MKIAYTTETFISKAKLIHHDTYDYSQVKYIAAILSVEIICKHHGVFNQTPNNHLAGKGCKYCGDNVKLTTEQFIERAKRIHGNKYDYSLCVYKNNRSSIILKCNIHGQFTTLPTNHLKGIDCEKCAIFKRGFDQRLSQQEFIKRSSKMHNYFYDYNKSIYINGKTKIEIKCPKHGYFKQIAEQHIKGTGCPKCRMSKGEREILKYLEDQSINYEYQKRFHDCKQKTYLVFDFFILSMNICIEFDGDQHRRPVKHFGGAKALIDTQERDRIKNEYCKLKNINLIRINNVSQILEKLTF